MKDKFFANSFLTFLGLVCMANLLVYNDWFSFFQGAETAVQSNILESRASWFSQFSQAKLQAVFPGQPFLYRLPSVIFIILGVYIIFHLGKSLFGSERLLNTVIVLAASPAIIIAGKLSTGDAAFFLAFSLLLLTAIRYLKTPGSLWLVSHWLFVGLSIWIHPWNTLLGLVGFTLVLYFLHPDGKRLLRLAHWAGLPLIFAVLYVLGAFPFPGSHFYLGFGNIGPGKFFLIHMAGVLPFWGFVGAGLWQVWKNGRKGEEWSIIQLAVFAAGLFSWSLVFQLSFAFLAARSLQDFQRENYPYFPLVRGLALLGLVGVFCLGAVGMLNGFYFLQGTGFRVVMAVCIAFWIPYFVSIIGLFGKKIGQYRNMAALAGAFALFFFLIQAGPVIEKLRSWQREVPLQVSQSGMDLIRHSELQQSEVFDYYARSNGIRLEEVSTFVLGTDVSATYLIDSAHWQTQNLSGWAIDTFPAWNTWWYFCSPAPLVPEEEKE